VRSWVGRIGDFAGVAAVFPEQPVLEHRFVPGAPLRLRREDCSVRSFLHDDLRDDPAPFSDEVDRL